MMLGVEAVMGPRLGGLMVGLSMIMLGLILLGLALRRRPD